MISPQWHAIQCAALVKIVTYCTFWLRKSFGLDRAGVVSSKIARNINKLTAHFIARRCDRRNKVIFCDRQSRTISISLQSNFKHQQSALKASLNWKKSASASLHPTRKERGSVFSSAAGWFQAVARRHPPVKVYAHSQQYGRRGQHFLGLFRFGEFGLFPVLLFDGRLGSCRRFCRSVTLRWFSSRRLRVRFHLLLNQVERNQP